ncbi:Uncharacterized protein Rs2_04159 [Raphanus sativus]|nr:Uncharacterized protein Rs2_04159 [Raphanus sativus]
MYRLNVSPHRNHQTLPTLPYISLFISFLTHHSPSLNCFPTFQIRLVMVLSPLCSSMAQDLILSVCILQYAVWVLANLLSGDVTVLLSLVLVLARLLSRSFWCASSLQSQIEGKLVDTLIPANRFVAGVHSPMASLVEQFLFPIFSPVWNELDGEVLLVLQGFCSWLMLFSAFVAEFVTSKPILALMYSLSGVKLF